MTPNTPALPPASTELAAIRDAISAGPTPGPWHYYTLGGQSPADVPAGGHLIELPRIHQDRSVAMRVEDARYIAAANPAAMTAVLAYVDALQAENQALRADARPGWLPIATAPKDGTPIIIADTGDGYVYDVVNGWFEVLTEDEEDGPWSLDGGKPHCSYVGRAEGTYFCSWLPGKELDTRWRVTESFGYTHWMPRPAAPAIDAAVSATGEGGQ